MDGEAQEARLGFRPQKELIFNNSLPYSEGLDEESCVFLSEIKLNLSRAVSLRELRPGCVTWIGRLTRYIVLYGLKFSKEDHICFIKLVYELILIPDLEPSLVALFANTLSSLLKKQDLVSPVDLQLPWRPLYKLMQNLLDSPYEDVGLILIPSGMDTTVRNVVKLCRDYFPEESTEEMLKEWRPLLCPFDVTMAMGIGLFETFLPTKMFPEQHSKGFKLWFNEFVGLWKMCHNQPSWEGDMLWLLARLAYYNIGHIDWEVLMPLMFSKTLQNFQLPVGYRQQRGQVGRKYDLGAVVTWIVATLGGGSSCQDHLTGLFKAIESYYHPSNMGSWHTKLHDFLRRLPAAFVKRVHRERSNKKTWLTPIPDSHKLTESDITRFVESLLPVCLLAMFSRFGAYEAGVAFHQLAQLRPELVIPPILERLYSALDTVTEPHRLTAALQCLVSVARPLVRGGKFYPQGPTHVIPLLMASLPAVDPNDLRKTLVTFQLVTTIATLVPIVDCSAAVSLEMDLTDEEQEVCSATTGFEDFILQFIDRCFNLIENSALEQTRMDRARATEKMNREESMLEVGLSSTLATLLMQCSSSIFDVALAKLHAYVSGRIFEPHVAGKFAAHICCSVAKVNTQKVLRVFTPHLFRSLHKALLSDDVLREETLDDELLFHLLLLSELVRSPGNHLLSYADDLTRVLDRALRLDSREGYQLAGAILNNMLRSLTTIYPTDYRSIPGGYDRPMSEHLPIRDWGRAGDINNLQMKWHVPSAEERSFASQLLDRYLAKHLVDLSRHADQISPMPREVLQRTLSHSLDCVLGAGALLPAWDEAVLPIANSCVTLLLPIKFAQPNADQWKINFTDGQHIRLSVARAVSKVVRQLIASGSDDTKSFFSTISIYQMLLFYHGVLKDDFETQQKNYQMVKKVLGCNLVGRKMDIRPLLVDRIQLQHEMRVLESAFTLSVITETTRVVLQDLISLSTSHYSEVRSRAQAVLGQFYRQHPLAYQVVLEELLMGFQPEATSEQLKGTLYLCLDGKQRSLLVKHDWKLMLRLWPAMLKAPPSEKPSIIQLLDAVSSLLYRFMETTSIRMSFTDACIECARALSPVPLDQVELADALKKESQLGQNNENTYYQLIGSLADLLINGSLHWRLYNLAFNMLCLQLRADLPLPCECVGIFVQNLIHDAIAVRKIAIKGVASILKQQKRKHKKIQIDPRQIASQFASPASFQKQTSDEQIRPGDRWDNSWMQYQSDHRPQSVEAWNQPRYVHKTHYGFYTWPEKMEVYAPEEEQPSLDRSCASLSAEEKVLYNFFSNQSNVDKLIGFLSLEERKGKDKFDARRFSMFKGLFRNFGDAFLVHFQPHLERLVCDQHEAAQRCAAEIITGLIRGSKHWSFAKIENLWQFLCPLLRTAFNHVSVESINDWGTAIATASENRDPNRIHWLMELILENPIRAEQGSFTDSSRLYMLQGGISQQEWRVSQLLSRLLNLLRPYLNHPYQNVRDRLGSVLTNIFLHDLEIPGGTKSSSPRVEDFVNEILPQLAPLLENSSRDSPVEKDSGQDEEERSRSLRLLKTVSQWLAGMWTRTYGCQPDVQLLFLPYLCNHESSDTDKELARECSLALCFIAQTVLRPSAIEIALRTVHQVAQNGTWKARIASLEFLQVLTFNNLFNVIDLAGGVDSVTSTVLLLLSDERVEVREKAAQVLGGLVHCNFLNGTKSVDLLAKFQKQISRRLPRTVRASVIQEVDMTLIIERHAGILGLCAFVDAYPYDVPEFLPSILVRLGDHLNDPQPIPVTVKKTLSNFRRTHYDNWQFHKQKFSDDQLVMLTDLLVSPNYYA